MKKQKNKQPQPLTGSLTRAEVKKLPYGFTPILRTSPKWFKSSTKKPILNNRKRTQGRPIVIVKNKTDKVIRLPLLSKAFLAINAFFKKQQESK